MKIAVQVTVVVLLLLLTALPAGAQTVFPGDRWQVATPQMQSLSPEGIANVGTWLKDNGSKTGLVVRHGRIVGEWYFDDATPETKYLVYSVTKSFAGTAVAVAIEAGELKLDSKVGDFFPEASPAQKRKVPGSIRTAARYALMASSWRPAWSSALARW